MTIIRDASKADDPVGLFRILSGRHRGRPSQEQKATSSPQTYHQCLSRESLQLQKKAVADAQRPMGFKVINYFSLADRQEVYALDDFLAFIAEAEVDKLLSDWAKWLAFVGQVVERAG